MEIPDAIETDAERIYDAYNPESRGKSPSATRAAATYIAYMRADRTDEVHQDDLADHFDCSAATLRQRIREMDDAIDLSTVGTDA